MYTWNLAKRKNKSHRHFFSRGYMAQTLGVIRAYYVHVRSTLYRARRRLYIQE